MKKKGKSKDKKGATPSKIEKFKAISPKIRAASNSVSPLSKSEIPDVQEFDPEDEKIIEQMRKEFLV